MKIVKYLIMSIILISCSDNDSIVSIDQENNSTAANLYSVDFELQYGFDNQSVNVKIDSLWYFSAYISEISPLSGVQSSFKTFLEEGTHKIYVSRQTLTESYSSDLDSTEVEISGYDKYYIGVTISSDSLFVKVQNEPFLYL